MTPPKKTSGVCRHGGLRRKCDICDLEETVSEKDRRLEEAREIVKDLHDLIARAIGFFDAVTICENTHPVCPCAELAADREKVKKLVSALEKIRSTNGLQYSDIFDICDKAISDLEEPKK